MQISLKDYFKVSLKKASWSITVAIVSIILMTALTVFSYFYIQKLNELALHSVPDFTYWAQVGDTFQASRTIDSLHSSDPDLLVTLNVLPAGQFGSQFESNDGLSLLFKSDGVFLKKSTSLKTVNNKVLGSLTFVLALPVFRFFVFLIIFAFSVKLVVSFLLRRVVKFSLDLVEPIEENLEILNSYNLNSYPSKKSKMSETKILEFSELNATILSLYNRIEAQQRTLKELTQKEVKDEMSAQFAHDIRSPLSILSNIRNEIDNLSEETRTKFLLSLKRIEDISEGLLNFKGEQPPVPTPLNIACLLEDIIYEKRLEFENIPALKIIQEFSSATDYFSAIDPSTLARIISNLLNNAKDSMEGVGRIFVRLSSSGNYHHIDIRDEGKGIDSEIQEKLFGKGSTNKKDGNGLGLYSAKKELVKISGDIALISTDNLGTIFRISLVAFSKNNQIAVQPNLSEVVLIDDDKLIRYDWVNYFKSNKIQCHCFSSVEEFIKLDSKFSKDILIYIDSDLGPELKGEIESEKIFKRGFNNLYLSTSYLKSEITKPYWIREIFSKDPRKIYKQQVIDVATLS